jgi:cysteine desulfurase
MKAIYLDNAATTPLDSRVLEAMLPWLGGNYGNASSVHSRGRQAKVLLEDARDTIAGFIGSRSSEVYFTSGGTEANNFALKGIAFNYFGSKDHIITTKIEHSAVIDTLEYLKTRFGFNVTYLGTDKYGMFDLSELSNSITPDTFLISVMHSNNELGVLSDITGISKIAKESNILLHTDSVQSIGKIHFNVNETGADTATLSAHKIFGPKGIGALFIRRETPIDKFMHGGKQERERRGGTENIAAIAGFKKAVDILKDEMDSDIKKFTLLRKKLLNLLNDTFGGSVIINSVNENSAQDNCGYLPNIINISFNPQKISVDPDTLLIKLDMAGIAVSSGSACASGSPQPSHVLKAIGYDDIAAKSSIRISFGRFNTESDVECIVKTLKNIIT